LNLKVLESAEPYWARPDLGIGKDDVVVKNGSVSVTVHSIGSVDSKPTELALVSGDGKVLSTTPVPALKAPVDLMPRTVTLSLKMPGRSSLQGTTVVLNPDNRFKEITRINNRVGL
jgi:hypothetical protein